MTSQHTSHSHWSRRLATLGACRDACAWARLVVPADWLATLEHRGSPRLVLAVEREAGGREVAVIAVPARGVALRAERVAL